PERHRVTLEESGENVRQAEDRSEQADAERDKKRHRNTRPQLAKLPAEQESQAREVEALDAIKQAVVDAADECDSAAGDAWDQVGRAHDKANDGNPEMKEKVHDKRR